MRRLSARGSGSSRTRGGSLTRNLVLLATVVATVAVLLAGFAAWRTARSNAEAQYRERLTRQAAVLSVAPSLSTLLLDQAQRLTGATGVRVAVVSPTAGWPARRAVPSPGRTVTPCWPVRTSPPRLCSTVPGYWWRAARHTTVPWSSPSPSPRSTPPPTGSAPAWPSR